MLSTRQRELANKIQENKKFSRLFDQLVPESGKCETVAGEMIRAFNRIGYRFFNDGDLLNIGYGIETVNPAARYLLSFKNDFITEVFELPIRRMSEAAEIEDITSYLEYMLLLEECVVDVIKLYPDFSKAEDMYECDYSVDFLYDTVDEYNDLYDDEDDWYDEDDYDEEW